MSHFDVWQDRQVISGTLRMMEILREAGLPLESSNSDSSESRSKIVCFAQVRMDRIQALIVTPSGLAYRFDSVLFDQDFWKFAAGHYYWVTGNAFDRNQAQRLVGGANITGRILDRKESGSLSAKTIDELLAACGYSDAPIQNELF